MPALFVTVGTSAIHNNRIGLAGPRTNEALLQAVAEFDADATKVKWEKGPYWRLFDQLFEAHIQAWRNPPDFFLDRSDVLSQRNYRTTSAELLSTYLMARTVPHLRDTSRVVLLASDTPAGIFAAELNRVVMQSDEYRARMGWANYQVRLEVVTDLDGKVTNSFREVRSLIASCAKEAGGGQVRINVTGGFKGFVATLGILAGKENYNLYYMHESLLQPFFIDSKAEQVVTRPAAHW